MIDLVSCVLTRAQTKRVLSKESEQSEYQTCCKPNWDDRGADPTNREYNICIALESVLNVSRITPTCSGPADNTARWLLNFNDFLLSQPNAQRCKYVSWLLYTRRHRGNGHAGVRKARPHGTQRTTQQPQSSHHC